MLGTQAPMGGAPGYASQAALAAEVSAGTWDRFL